jgi:Bacterial TSP3 repeat
MLGTRTLLNVMLGTAAFAGLLVVAGPARAQALVINQSGGTTNANGLRISVNQGTQIQILRRNLAQIYTDGGQGAFEPGPAKIGSGVFVTIGTGAPAKTIGPKMVDYMDAQAQASMTNWALVSRTGGSPNGDGVVTTKHTAAVNARTYGLTTTYTYKFPNNFVNVATELVVPAGNVDTVRLYLPTDGNLGGSDVGQHRFLAAPVAFLQVYDAPNNLAMGWRAAGGTPWTGYLGGLNRCQWNQFQASQPECGSKSANLQRGVDWPNYVDPAIVDSGVGVMWNFGTAPGTYKSNADFVFTTYCTSNAQCGFDEPVCNTAVNQCGGCVKDADCAATEWCNISTAVCSARIDNGGALPNDPGHKAPAPTLDAKCSPTAAPLVCKSAVCETVDDKCGLINGSACPGGPAQCRSTICFAADSKCGKPTGTVCGAPAECRSGDCTGGKCAGDSDGDGVSDAIENALGTDPLRKDTDGDGVPDNVELSPDHSGNGPFSAVDTDGDGVIDAKDTDDDGDSILTKDELGGAAQPRDTDGDNIPDYLDVDDDSDTIPTLKEATDSKLPGLSDDVDKDGKLNWLDTDADGDSIADKDESADVDANGKPDYLEPAGGAGAKKPNGETCAAASDCVSDLCDKDGKCGSPDGAGCASASTCRSAVCRDGICGTSTGQPGGNAAGAVAGGSVEGGGIGCATAPNSANATAGILGLALALSALGRRRKR